jgi:ATP/maltotriose-dependent transcriptional regulator MalT
VNVLIDLAGAANDLDEGGARLLESEEQEARRQNDRWLEAWMVWRRARLALEKGDLSRARLLVDRARKLPQDIPRPSLLVPIAVLRMFIAEADGDGVAARAAVEETVAALDKTENVFTTGMMKALLARLSLAEGKDQEVDELVRAAEVELSDSPDQTMGAVALADALLSRGRIDDAARIFAGARERMSPAYSAFERMSFTIVEQRLLASSRKMADVAAARDALDDLGIKAAAQGYHYSSLQARLAAGELALRSGQPAVGRALLSLLVKEAKQRGFVAVAQRAARLVAQAG